MAFPIIAARLFERMAKETLTPEAMATITDAISAFASPLKSNEKIVISYAEVIFQCVIGYIIKQCTK